THPPSLPYRDLPHRPPPATQQTGPGWPPAACGRRRYTRTCSATPPPGVARPRRFLGCTQRSGCGAGAREPNYPQHQTQEDGAELAPLVAAWLGGLPVMGHEEGEVPRPHHLHSHERNRQRAELAELHRAVTAPDARALLVYRAE